MCVSILRNHPFVDGNKRAGFVSLGVTLSMNGLYRDVRESEATRVVLGVAASEKSDDGLQRWVAANCQSASADHRNIPPGDCSRPPPTIEIRATTYFTFCQAPLSMAIMYDHLYRYDLADILYQILRIPIYGHPKDTIHKDQLYRL
ncbi:hypothetical protein [Zavarzinia sp.]|uniref:hypothetical protein n=1 Tax=Zavarzinia sp. TaxID=2027920 RepID=UPI003BB4F9A1